MKVTAFALTVSKFCCIGMSLLSDAKTSSIKDMSMLISIQCKTVTVNKRDVWFDDRNDVVAKRVKFGEEEKKEEEQQQQQEEEKEETTVEEKGKFLEGSANLDDITASTSLRERSGVTSDLKSDVMLPTIREPIFPLSGGWKFDESNEEYSDKEVQTDIIYNSNDSGEIDTSPKSETPRSLEDCLEIYQSQVRK
jgi:hypothetical protein